jgi:hypothetical protein
LPVARQSKIKNPKSKIKTAFPASTAFSVWSPSVPLEPDSAAWKVYSLHSPAQAALAEAPSFASGPPPMAEIMPQSGHSLPWLADNSIQSK